MTHPTNLSFVLKFFIILLALSGYNNQMLVEARRRSHTFPLELRESLFSNDAQLRLGASGAAGMMSSQNGLRGGKDLGGGMILYDDGMKVVPPPTRTRTSFSNGSANGLTARGQKCVPLVNPTPSALSGGSGNGGSESGSGTDGTDNPGSASNASQASGAGRGSPICRSLYGFSGVGVAGALMLWVLL